MTSNDPVRVLVAFGSKRGGTAEIATAIGDELRAMGHEVTCERASAIRDLEPYDAVIVGGALYAGRWIAEARRFVTRNSEALRRRHVWMFSSGPLDDSAMRNEVPPPPRVAALMARAGARGHRMFGGRLTVDATGLLAAAMAKSHAGDWRDFDQIRSWARTVAGQIASAPHVATMPAPKARWGLATLCLAVGISAIGGGVALVARPDGSLVRMSVAQLRHSPFSNFLIPGLVLLLVIGLGNTLAGSLVARKLAHATSAARIAGAVLLVWIVAQMIFLRTVHPLQVGFLAVALAIEVVSLRPRRRPASAAS